MRGLFFPKNVTEIELDDDGGIRYYFNSYELPKKIKESLNTMLAYGLPPRYVDKGNVRYFVKFTKKFEVIGAECNNMLAVSYGITYMDIRGYQNKIDRFMRDAAAKCKHTVVREEHNEKIFDAGT